MVHQKVTEPSNVNSHIQMPKLLLRRFHNDKTRFCYYDVKGRFIGTKGTAEATNTEFGYFSIEIEHFLRDKIETPFGKILAYIDGIDFEQEYFPMTPDFEQSTRAFIYSLMSRDPAMVNEMNENSFFSQFLPTQFRHDYAAINGIALAKQNKLLSEYILTFLVNRTDIPFVLPIAGLYDYNLNGHSVINLPISPKIAICLVHEGYSDRLIHDDGTVSMFMVEFPDVIMRMNNWAFTSQKKRNWGRIICPYRDELDRLMKGSSIEK